MFFLSRARFWHFIASTKCQTDNTQLATLPNWKSLSFISLLSSHCYSGFGSLFGQRQIHFWFIQRKLGSSFFEIILARKIKGTGKNDDMIDGGPLIGMAHFLFKSNQIKQLSFICSFRVFNRQMRIEQILDEFNVFHDPNKVPVSLLFRGISCFRMRCTQWDATTLPRFQLLHILLFGISSSH